MNIVDTVFNFFLFVILFVAGVAALLYIAHGTPTGQNLCISATSGSVSDLRSKITTAREENRNVPYSFEILDCVKCMWYDSFNEEMVVIYSLRSGFLSPEELMERRYPISANFDGVGCNCSSCEENNGADPAIYCANIRKDDYSPYQFEIDRTTVKCLNCPGSTNLCGINFKPCACPTGLCNILECGESVNGSINIAGEKKYYEYTLSAPSDVKINLTTENGNLYWLYVNWDGSCTRPGVYDCSRAYTNEQICERDNLPAGTYYINVLRLGTEEMNYTLSLEC